jgi:serine/threonine protein phosphatase PrpC
VNGLRYIGTARSHVGRVRQANEDSLLARPEIGLWAVADGMGGHQRGDYASRLITDRLASLPSASDAQSLRHAVEQTLDECHQHLLAYGGADTVCGSTILALLIWDRHFACLWAGDSRLYRQRADHFERLSTDHSVVQELVERGELSRLDALTHPWRNRITRAVGVGPELELEAIHGAVLSGDLFLLCSDGLSSEVDDPRIARILETQPLDSAADALLEQALAAGGRDNITLVLVRCLDDDNETTIPRNRRRSWNS